MSYGRTEPSGSVVSQGEFLPHPFVREFVDERPVCATVVEGCLRQRLGRTAAYPLEPVGISPFGDGAAAEPGDERCRDNGLSDTGVRADDGEAQARSASAAAPNAARQRSKSASVWVACGASQIQLVPSGTVGGRSGVGLDRLDERLLVLNADHPVFGLAVDEQIQRGNALDLVPGGELLVGVNVHLGDGRGRRLGDRLDGRLEHLAGAAPVGVEVREHDVEVGQQLLEVVVALDVDWLVGRPRPAAELLFLLLADVLDVFCVAHARP